VKYPPALSAKLKINLFVALSVSRNFPVPEFFSTFRPTKQLAFVTVPKTTVDEDYGVVLA
jgi:hypothetical protein